MSAHRDDGRAGASRRIAPARAGGAGRRDDPRRRALRALLEGDDVLLDRAADDLPARVRARLRRAACRTSGTCSYVEYVATGVVATAVLFSSAFPGMFNTFIRWQFQRTYDAMLAAPVDVEELVTAEILWISMRAGVYGLAPLLVGDRRSAWTRTRGMLLVPLIGFVTGFGFAAFGVTARRDRQDDRQLQLRHERRADADVPGRRARSSRSRTLPPGSARRRSSTRSTTACSSCATPRSETSAPADLGHAGRAGRVRAADVAAGDLAARAGG